MQKWIHNKEEQSSIFLIMQTQTSSLLQNFPNFFVDLVLSEIVLQMSLVFLLKSNHKQKRKRVKTYFNNLFFFLKRWFHGFLTLEETKKFLEFQPVGTFLMRFSSSKPGSFALAFTSAPRSVTHVIIKTAPPRGFSIQEENSEKYFEHVSQIVTYYSSVLTRPFDSALPEEVYVYKENNFIIIIIFINH